MRCSQEVVTSRGLKQEELSLDYGSTTDIMDSAAKRIFLNVFQRWPFALGAETNVPGFQCQSWCKCLGLTAAENLSWLSSCLI